MPPTNDAPDMTPDINAEATRAQCERSSDLRLIPQAGGNFHPAKVSASALNDVLGTIDWSIDDAVQFDPCVAECARGLVRWMASRGRLPDANLSEAEADLQWSKYRMLFAGLGHAHHAGIVEAFEKLNAGCPWAMEDERTWRDNIWTARHASNWPATLLLVPWVKLAKASFPSDSEMNVSGPDYGTPWAEACLMWHILRHLRRSEKYGLVYTYNGGAGAFDIIKGSTHIANQVSVIPLASVLDIPIRVSKDAHIFAPLARALLTESGRDRLLTRTSLALLPAVVIPSPATSYQTDRSVESRFFQHGLRLTHLWIAAAGEVKEAADVHLYPGDILGYDWRPTEPDASTMEKQEGWMQRLVPHYDNSRWPSQIFHACFPNTCWCLANVEAHQALFDATMLLSTVRSAHPKLMEEFPFIVLLPRNPTTSDSIQNGKTTATRAILSAFNADAPTGTVGGTATGPETRSILVDIRDYGTVGLEEFALPSDASHPLNAKALSTFCTGGHRKCGLVYSNESHLIRLRHPLVVSAKTMMMPPDLESRGLFLWLDRLSDDDNDKRENYLDAISGRTGLEMRLAAVALVDRPDILEWISRIQGQTTRDGWRFGIHREVAAWCYASRCGVSMDAAFVEIDSICQVMRKKYKEHAGESRANGLLDMVESGRPYTLAVEELFDVTPAQMGIIVEKVRRHAGEADGEMTAPQMLRAVLETQTASDPNAQLGEKLARHIGKPSFEKCQKRLIETLLKDDLMEKVPAIDDRHMFHGELGMAGWWVKRVAAEKGKPPRFALGCDNPALDAGALRHKAKPFETPHSPNRGAPIRT